MTDEAEPAGLEASRYQLLVDAIFDYAIYMLSPEGVVSSWNPGAQRFKGYAPSEIIGQHFSRFYTEADRARGLPATALRTATEEGRFEQEGWRVRKDGSQFWAYVIIDPIRSPAGDLLGFAKVTRDLTEKRAADQALRASEEQFRLLVKGVTDYAIYMLDPRGMVSSWNAGAERIKGYAPDEIIGAHFSTFYTEADRGAGLPARALDIAAREGRFEHEGVRVRKNGEHFSAHVIIDAIHDDSGELIGFAKVTRDITEKVQAQKSLEEAREALFQSQKLEAIGQLTGGVAHDFNNLLTAILGSLEMAKKRLPDDPHLQRLINNAMQGAQRGATLTQRMLAFARRQELKSQAVDLAALVQGMADLIDRSLPASIQINIRLLPGLPLVESDPAQLESALLNLVVNARDALGESGTITISARAEQLACAADGLQAGAYVVLSVADNGEGMDEETLARATDPFFTTKGVGKGTGLGLSMVQGLSLQSGGRLAIRSKPGQGTTVELWLPAADASAAPEAAAPGPQPASAGRPLTILAVDDDELVLLNTAAMLEDLGHTAIEARNAGQALAVLEQGPLPDLVLTDHAMPKMTGLQLAIEIGRRWPGLPVVLATGYAELPENTAFPRLSKPFNLEELDGIIRLNAGARTLEAVG